MSNYDVIVVGTGGVGSGALFHLASRGVRVLGIDRFPGGHDRGSSHGQTRIIRQAYFEHPDYVPLLLRAYQLWRELEQLENTQLYFETGLLEIGPSDGVVVPGVLNSAALHGLDIERVGSSEAARRFPGFVVPDHFEAVFERRAGFLLVEQCVLAHLSAAQRAGAELAIGQEVVEWRANGSGVTVRTRDAQYHAARLVVTAGAWARDLLQDLGIPLRVVLKHLHWYASADACYEQSRGCPAFFYEVPDGFFYGFPQIDALGVKVAEHTGGAVVADPLSPNRDVDPTDRRRVEQFLSAHLPRVTMNPTHHATCLYTMSPDEHFIVDQHPHDPRIIFAAGLSGHGFKFTGVLGEILADLALNNRTDHPIGFLSCRRASLQITAAASPQSK